MIAPVLLIVALASQPSAPNSTVEPTNQTAAQEQKAGTEIRISGQPVRITIGDQPSPPQITNSPSDTGNHEEASTAINRSIRNATTWIAVLTFCLVVVGIGQVIIYAKTRETIQRQV